MGISDRLMAYLESPRNVIGCAAGTGGLGLYFAGSAGPWWPAVVAGLYGAGALLAPADWEWFLRLRRRPVKLPPVGSLPGIGVAGGPAVGGPTVKVRKGLPPDLRTELTELRQRAAAVGLPSSVDAEGLFAALASAEAGQARQILGRELPLALDGYVRARSWETLLPGGVDPAAALKAELERLAGLL